MTTPGAAATVSAGAKFTDLGLDAALLKALEGEGYTTPTPIQAQAIPSVLAGKDLLGIAQTGTGKTAAFALPILHRLSADRKAPLRRGCRVLVLAPTRELATQIADSFRTYGRHIGVKVALVYGGVGHRPQVQAMAAGVDILVATPGRLLDHMGERAIDLSGTEILVLDEADQMMDLGFIRPLRQIIAKLPAKRQTLFFSATMPGEISSLAGDLLRDPVKVAVTPIAKTADRVTQKVILVEQTKKRAMLVELFTDPVLTRTLVFTRTKRGADRVAKHLETAGIRCAAIHGNKSQGQREQALAAFKAGKIRALIATDIAARGIDIDAVSHVVNFEMPNVPESYVHRIGRTARAGAEGIAISLVDGEERAYLRDIERLTRQTIASTDRRGDATLVAGEVERSARDDRQAAGRRGGSGNGPGHSRTGGDRHRAAPHHRRDDDPRQSADGVTAFPDNRKRNGGHWTPHGDGQAAQGATRSANGDGSKPHGEHRRPQGDGRKHNSEARSHSHGERSHHRGDPRKPENAREHHRAEGGPRPARASDAPARNDGPDVGLGQVGFLKNRPSGAPAQPGSGGNGKGHRSRDDGNRAQPGRRDDRNGDRGRRWSSKPGQRNAQR